MGLPDCLMTSTSDSLNAIATLRIELFDTAP